MLTHWGRDKMDAISQTTFSNEFSWMKLYEYRLNIPLKFVPQGPNNNIPALVQIMAWRRPGDKPLSAPMMVRLPTHICVTRPQWVNLEIHIFSKIFIFKTCHLYLHTGSNIYLGEPSVGHRASLSSLSFCIICAAAALKKMFPCAFINTILETLF